MLRYFLLSLLFSLSGIAEEELLRASLRFQIWVPQGSVGIMIEADPSLRREPVQEELFLQSGETYFPVLCRELRRSAEVEYVGGAELLLHRSDGETKEVVARCWLPDSGEFRVILMKQGDGYQAFPVPLDSEKLAPGCVQMVNTTSRAVTVQQHQRRAVLLRRNEVKLMRLAQPHEPTVHLTIRARRNSKWVAEYSRPYTLRKNARTVCFFYETESSKRLQMKFFSGL